MSLYSAMYAGVSGLNSESAAMATVADNITNVNTIGYKSVQADFSTMVAGGRTASTYVAGGVKVAPQTLVSKNGTFQAGSYDTSMAIDGNGFFVVQNGTAADSQIAYTRAGNFTRDEAGNLKNSAGYYLLGLPLGVNDDPNANIGNIDPNQLELVNPYKISGAASPTTKFGVSINLDSTTAVFSDADNDGVTDAGAYTAGDMASGAITPQFSRPYTLYDAQGNAHQVTMGFIKTGANEWRSEIYATPASDVSGVTNGLLASGTVKFNGDGSYDLAGSSMPASITPNWTNGANAQPIELGMGSQDDLDGMMSMANPSEGRSFDINGGPPVAVTSVSISDRGVVNAVFEDGSMRALYRLPLATFKNPDGLKAMNGTAFQVTAESGGANINAAGAAGSGAIAAGQLEGSTADIGKEFTNMILFQRAYSASSKIITTVDDMLQELTNMKR